MYALWRLQGMRSWNFLSSVGGSRAYQRAFVECVGIEFGIVYRNTVMILGGYM